MSNMNSDSDKNKAGLSVENGEDSKLMTTYEKKDRGNDNEDVKGKEEDTSHLPIDKGWAWVVLAACFFEIAVYGGMMRSFGVFFLQFQQRFSSSASATAIMNLIQNVCISVSALFVMTIGLQFFSWRTSVYIGGLLTVTGYLVAAYANKLWILYLAFGAATGIGHSFIHPPIFSVIGTYFNKHRGLANSIFASGGSVGGLVLAPLIVVLFEEYGYQGAMLIISGILMNIFVSGSLLRPMEFFEKRRKKIIVTNIALHTEDITTLQSDNGKIIVPNSENKDQSDAGMRRVDKARDAYFRRLNSHDPDVSPANHQHSPLLKRVRAQSEGDKHLRNSNTKDDIEMHPENKSPLGKVLDVLSRSQATLYTSGEGLCGSLMDVNVPDTSVVRSDRKVDQDDLELSINTVERAEGHNGCCVSLKRSAVTLLCTLFDMNLLKKPVFLTFLFMAFCFMSGVSLMPVFVPTHAYDVGLSNSQIGTLIAMQAVIDLIAKISMGIVADRGWLKRSTILATAAFVLGCANQLIRFVDSFYTVLALQIISGLCCGQYMSMFAVFLMDIIGAEYFKKSLGFVTVVHGASIAVVFPIGGLLKDYTGRYIATFHLLGGLAFVAGVFVLLIPRVYKRTSKSNKQ